MYLFIFSYCCSMFAIIHRSMAWIYNCKCVHLDERRSRWKFFEESNESHNHSIYQLAPDDVQIKQRAAYHREKFMYELENQNGFTLEPTIEHLLQLHLCFAGYGNSHDFFSRWTSFHEQNTWYIHTMCKEKITTFKKHLRNESINTFNFITITYNYYITNM